MRPIPGHSARLTCLALVAGLVPLAHGESSTFASATLAGASDMNAGAGTANASVSGPVFGAGPARTQYSATFQASAAAPVAGVVPGHVAYVATISNTHRALGPKENAGFFSSTQASSTVVFDLPGVSSGDLIMLRVELTTNASLGSAGQLDAVLRIEGANGNYLQATVTGSHGVPGAPVTGVGHLGIHEGAFNVEVESGGDAGANPESGPGRKRGWLYVSDGEPVTFTLLSTSDGGRVGYIGGIRAVAIPEPATNLLALAGGPLVWLAFRRRRTCLARSASKEN